MSRSARLIVALISLMVVLLFALKGGAVALTWADYFSLLTRPFASDELQRMVVFQLRLPRILFAALVGGALALSGTAMQALFRNPLAEPGLVGLSAGAAFGTVLALSAGLSGLIWIGLAGFAGGLVAMMIAYALGRRFQGLAGMLLAGVAINACAMSVVSLLITYASDAQLRSYSFWSLGSLTRANWSVVGLLLPWTLLWSCVICFHWRVLNALLIGEREAHHLGFDLTRIRGIMMVSIALLVGPLIAVTGGIAFVGLVVPHLLRMRFGSDHRLLLPMSALVGAIVLVLADWLSRVVVLPAELPVGVVTSLFGGPFFLWLLMRMKAGQTG